MIFWFCDLYSMVPSIPQTMKPMWIRTVTSLFSKKYFMILLSIICYELKLKHQSKVGIDVSRPDKLVRNILCVLYNEDLVKDRYVLCHQRWVVSSIAWIFLV